MKALRDKIPAICGFTAWVVFWAAIIGLLMHAEIAGTLISKLRAAETVTEDYSLSCTHVLDGVHRCTNQEVICYLGRDGASIACKWRK